MVVMTGRKEVGLWLVIGRAKGLHILVWGENWTELVNLRGESQPRSPKDDEIT